MRKIITVWNAYGDEITTGKTYYTIKHIESCIASGNYYRNLGYEVPVHVKSQIPVVARKARYNYKCDSCGANIYPGNIYAKSAAKFAINKFCIDCISPVKEEDKIEEIKRVHN